jgi:hypothetical protein
MQQLYLLVFFQFIFGTPETTHIKHFCLKMPFLKHRNKQYKIGIVRIKVEPVFIRRSKNLLIVLVTPAWFNPFFPCGNNIIPYFPATVIFSIPSDN